MASNATRIGQRYGEAVGNFDTDLKTGVNGIMLTWANQSIAIMRKIITRKARTKHASTLAADLAPKPTRDGIQIITEQEYWDYVNQGVRGVFNNNKAPKSPYKFKNLYTPERMVESFKEYIARTGSRGLKKQTLIRKNKKKQADLIDREAKQMAVATKISGIKPMNFTEPAIGPRRIKVLSNKLSKELKSQITMSILK